MSKPNDFYLTMDDMSVIMFAGFAALADVIEPEAIHRVLNTLARLADSPGRTPAAAEGIRQRGASCCRPRCRGGGGRRRACWRGARRCRSAGSRVRHEENRQRDDSQQGKSYRCEYFGALARGADVGGQQPKNTGGKPRAFDGGGSPASLAARASTRPTIKPVAIKAASQPAVPAR
jgi:hypothetical protein